MAKIARTVPNVKFPVRIDNDESGFDWGEIDTESIFAGRRILVFSLPGAFTPTCTMNQLPGFEAYFDQIKQYGRRADLLELRKLTHFAEPRTSCEWNLIRANSRVQQEGILLSSTVMEGGSLFVLMLCPGPMYRRSASARIRMQFQGVGAQFSM